MNIGEVIRFHDERFFEGAVQLGWVQKRPEQAQQAATSFVFHGPRYHGASEAEKDGVEGGYRLKDTASFVRDLLASIQAGQEGKDVNPYWLVVAGYGSGKSHLALTCASLLADPTSDTSQSIIQQLTQADETIGLEVRHQVAAMDKPALILPLDGMSGFHLGNALSQAVFKQLQYYGVDAGPIRNLSPRFQAAEQFVDRNFSVRTDDFLNRLPGLDPEKICGRLRENDEAVYAEVDAIYADANGHPIPVEGQESAQELIDTLSNVYCSSDGPFSQVVIFFDEFGRYLEYAAEKPLLAGDSALQQIFQGVQDNSAKVRFLGFIQYELRAYLKRFGGADLRQLQRYVTRFDSADKWYLSSNLETIFAHMIGKDEASLDSVWEKTEADRQYQLSHARLAESLPGFSRFPVWSDLERYTQIIGRGCWPLHPLAVWFLTRQRDIVQSRSALTFIKDIIERISGDEVAPGGVLRQVSAADLVLRSMLSELVAAEREVGGTIAETLQVLLEKYSGHLDNDQQLVLAGVAALAKMRIGKQTHETADVLLCEATALNSSSSAVAINALAELGALEWNRDLGQYELLSDGASRAQFQQWLRKQQLDYSEDAIRNLFVRRGAVDIELGDITPDFALGNQITTPDWFFESSLAHCHNIENVIERAFKEWSEAVLPKESKGKVIYLYLHQNDDRTALAQLVARCFDAQLKRVGCSHAPVWVIGLEDNNGVLAEQMIRLYLFDEKVSPADEERYRRFIPDEQEQSYQVLRQAAKVSIGKRLYWIAGFDDVPNGRMRVVGKTIFSVVYPKALPFPFDGFASGSGGGALDAGQLTRGLIARQIDGPWVQAQPRRLQNRANTLLVNSWGSLLPSGRLCAPQEPAVKAVYQDLIKAHQNNTSRSLLTSYRELIKPPYGMNATSAGVMLGLLLALDTPPRRIEKAGVLVSSADWLRTAFPGRAGNHHLEQKVLTETCLRFLSEDSESIWRGLLHRWEAEQHYAQKLELAEEATRLLKIDPLPEAMEGNFKYLIDATNEIRRKLGEVKERISGWERGIEKAISRQSTSHAISIGSKLCDQKAKMETSGLWPEELIHECDTLLQFVHELIAQGVGEWIQRQICRSVVQVNEFREEMEKASRSLSKLGFEKDSQALITQAHSSIRRVEELQKFKLTLDESDDYPRQPDPSQSTPVRKLRDEIAKGDELIINLKQASSALTNDEIEVRTAAIKKRQEKLRGAVKSRQKALGTLYSAPESEQDLREMLAQANQLREVFLSTPDESEVSELVMQLRHILSDIGSWEAGEVGSSRLSEIINAQIECQRADLEGQLKTQEIEAAWDLEGIYRSIASEHINKAVRRSREWTNPRLELVDQIGHFNKQRCCTLERELSAAPAYLSEDDSQKIRGLLEKVKQQLLLLDEQARQEGVRQWLQRFLSVQDINELDRRDTELLLRELQAPPHELTESEHAVIDPIAGELTKHLDQMSIDDIVNRIRQLPKDKQQVIYQILADSLNLELA